MKIKKDRTPRSRLIRIEVRFDCSEEICLDCKGRPVINKCNLKSLEHRDCISWYYHDVFQPIKYVLWNGKPWGEGMGLYLPEAELYDQEKLKLLANSESFKNKKYAFFFYGVVERLLGQKVTTKGMSGLFAKGAGF